MKPREERKRDLVQEWLDRAGEDLGLAEYLFSEGVYYRAIGFNAQQAAEKYIKAFLVWHQIDFPKIHDLGKLLNLAARVDPDIAESLRNITELNIFGAEIRYPSDLPDVTHPEAKRAVELAEMVRDEIIIHLPPRKK